jgi:adenylate cyclase class 2
LRPWLYGFFFGGKMKKTEFEARVLEINHEELVKKLESLGAELKFSALQERMVYDLKPKQENKWVRLRTNGKKTTLTIKDLEAKTIDGTKELEIEVSDFKTANEILETLGYKSRGFQQNKRTQYILDGVEVDLDKWPLIPEYMEVEGKNEKEVYDCLEKLGYQKEDIVTLDVSSIYDHYGYDGDNLTDLYFEMEENKK